jgi:hypothetical protein
MSRRTQDNLIAVAIAIVFIGVIVMSLQYGPRARMVPIPLAVFGLILIVAQIVWQNVRSGEGLKVDMLEVLTSRTEEESISGMACGSSDEEAAPAKRRPRWLQELTANGVVALFLFLILLLGPITAVFIFTGGYLLLSKHYSWLKGLIYTFVFTAMIYLFFVTALDLQLYHGILEPLVDRFR